MSWASHNLSRCRNRHSSIRVPAGCSPSSGAGPHQKATLACDSTQRPSGPSPAESAESASTNRCPWPDTRNPRKERSMVRLVVRGGSSHLDRLVVVLPCRHVLLHVVQHHQDVPGLETSPSRDCRDSYSGRRAERKTPVSADEPLLHRSSPPPRRIERDERGTHRGGVPITGAARRSNGLDWPRTDIVGTPRPRGSRCVPRAGSR